jgi:hypothetical protein
MAERPRRFIRPGAFDPEVTYPPRPGLGSRIEQCTSTGRYRTAMDELLQILRHHPADPEALFLCAIVLSASRTKQIVAAEPLGERYTNDRRLDPLCVACRKCETSWFTSVVHFSVGPETQMYVTNPIGLQCQECGYTLCRDCLRKGPIGFGMDVYLHPCPHCQGEQLTTPVLPTGREPCQFERRSERITVAVLFREGPIPPDVAFMTHFFECMSPDVIEDQPRIIGVPVSPWPSNPAIYTITYLLGLADRGIIDKAAVETAATNDATDREGLHLYLVRLYQRRAARNPGPYVVQ